MVTNGVPVEVGVVDARPGRRPLGACCRAHRQDRGRRPPGAPRRDARRGAGARAPPCTTATASFPHASVDALKRAGYFAAPIPAEHGGLGVTSVHDVVVASSRLARGDASVAIGVNMHLVVVLNIVRRWQIAVAPATSGAPRRSARRWGRSLATASSSPPRSASRARTSPGRGPPRRARATGWRIDGRKAFCTMSPAATVLYTAVTFVDDDGVERYGYAQVPADAAGRRDPRRLGRARHARLGQPLGDVRPASRSRAPRCAAASPPATPTAYMDRNLVAGLFHASASLGIAESAARPRRRRSARSRTRARARWSPRTRSSSAPPGDALARATLVDESEGDLTRCSPRPRRRRRSSTRPRPDRRPRARALGRRRLPQRPPARARVPRRPRRQLHAPARRQPRLRPARRRRARPRACSPLSRADPAGGVRALGHRRRVRHHRGRRLAAGADRQLVRRRLPAAASGVVLPGARLAHVAADAARRPLRVNVLEAGHGEFARRAAEPGADRFAEPLCDAVAVIECASRPSIRPATTRSSSAACAACTSVRAATRSSTSPRSATSTPPRRSTAQLEPSSTPACCATTSARCTATSRRSPTATSTSRPAGRVAERLGYPADWLDAVPAEALASFAGVGHMLDLAAIQPGETVLDLGSGSGTDSLHRRAPHRPDRAA